MTSMSVFAIDPGTTTGWAYVKDAPSPHTPRTEHSLEVACDQMGGEEYQQAYDLYRLIERVWPCAIIIEDFIPRQLNKERWFLSPVRVTNQLTMLLWLKDHQWSLQMPSLAKTTVNDDVLKRVGLHNPGRPHANDATRHALTFLRRASNKPALYRDLLEAKGLNTMTPNVAD